MLADGYEVIAEIPSSSDYRALRVAAGLSAKTEEAAALGLPNSVFAVVVRKNELVVGMGRVIGDKGLFLQIVDIAVYPEHQGRGLGKAIVRALVDHIQATTPDSAYVSLIAGGNAKFLYQQFGFASVAPNSEGMCLYIRRPKS
jgi:ribosomal protein S18 acetylase RimI-like enzyme